MSELVRAFGKPEFSVTLAEAIRNNVSRLPTEKACLVGGWPRNEVVTAVSGEGESPDYVFADVNVLFDEVLSPLCGTQPDHIPRTLGCRHKIDQKTGKAIVKAVEDDDSPEEF